MPKFPPDRWLGLFFIICALLLVFVWIPLDVETGYLEKARRSVTLGDSLAPAIAGGIIFLGGLILLISPDANSKSLVIDNLKWLALLLTIIGISLGLVRYAGPLITGLFTDEAYRVLRDTLPWKYIGYLLGGTTLIFALITLVEGRFRWKRLLIAFIATLLIALFYDLPFDDLLLPPNGDV